MTRRYDRMVDAAAGATGGGGVQCLAVSTPERVVRRHVCVARLGEGGSP